MVWGTKGPEEKVRIPFFVNIYRKWHPPYLSDEIRIADEVLEVVAELGSEVDVADNQLRGIGIRKSKQKKKNHTKKVSLNF
jgi:hypothetical protein